MSKDATEYSDGELFDRFTILVRKTQFDQKNYDAKLQAFVLRLSSIEITSTLLLAVCRLQMINVDIWNLESDLRGGNEGDLGLAEVGKRALKIRDLNKVRIEMVNAINHLLGDDTTERKFDHASE